VWKALEEKNGFPISGRVTGSRTSGPVRENFIKKKSGTTNTCGKIGKGKRELTNKVPQQENRLEGNLCLAGAGSSSD